MNILHSLNYMILHLIAAIFLRLSITDDLCRRFTAQVFLHILPQVYTCGYMLRPLSRPVWALCIPRLANRFMLINHRFTPVVRCLAAHAATILEMKGDNADRVALADHQKNASFFGCFVHCRCIFGQVRNFFTIDR